MPANRVKGYNIAYVSHVYHHNTGHDATDWPASWGFLTATDPIVLTEFGPFSNQSSEVNCGLDYVTSLLDFADSKSVSWTSWARLGLQRPGGQWRKGRPRATAASHLSDRVAGRRSAHRARER